MKKKVTLHEVIDPEIDSAPIRFFVITLEDGTVIDVLYNSKAYEVRALLPHPRPGESNEPVA